MKPGSRQRTCLFCGNILQPKSAGKNAKTDEHVIPEWLQKHLGIPGTPVTPMLFQTDTRQILDTRQHVMGAFKAGTICYKCNQGWMSNLEQEAKPILIRLIADPQQLTALTEPERLIVARWTLKTAAVLNRSSIYGDPANEMARPVPDEHMRTVSSGQIPDGVLVLGAGYQSRKVFDFLQYALWSAPKNSVPLRPENRERSYKIALAFRDLVLIVAYYPASDYRYGVNENHYVRLWTGGRAVLPINHLMDDSPPHSSTPNLELLLRNISVVSETWAKLVENFATTQFVVS